MLGTALSTLSKLDLSKVDTNDVARIATILRDSARFDTRNVARRGRRYARQTGQLIAANPRRSGLGLGGAAILGLAGYAAYKMYQSNKPGVENAVEEAKDAAAEMAEDVKEHAKSA